MRTLNARSVQHLSWDMSTLLIFPKYSSTMAWQSLDAARRLKQSLMDKHGRMLGKTTSSHARSHIVGASWSGDEHVVDMTWNADKLLSDTKETNI